MYPQTHTHTHTVKGRAPGDPASLYSHKRELERGRERKIRIGEKSYNHGPNKKKEKGMSGKY